MIKAKTKSRACRLACLVLALLMSGCAAQDNGSPAPAPGGGKGDAMTPDAGSAQSTVVTNLTAGRESAAPSGGMEDAAAISDFAANLFAAAMDIEGENPAISPVSAYLALAMAAEGAAGDTLREFEEVLGLSGPALSALCAGIMEAFEKTAGSTDLAIANSAWIDTAEGLIVENSWLDSIKGAMGAEVYSADLSTKEAISAINGWVEAATRGLIPAFRAEPYDSDTMLVLLNALYFKAGWETRFAASATQEGAFTKADGDVVQADFMGEWSCYRYYISLDGAEGTILPYDDGKTAFLALMPQEGTDVRDFAAALTAEKLAEYCAAAQPDTFMNITMPKFTAETEFLMNDALKAMGLADAFDPGKANLFPMGRARDPLYIANVLQKVKLIVDEEGTEAAAATSVEVATRCALDSDTPVELHFERPFVYAVIDLASGVPLFMGALENPAA